MVGGGGAAHVIRLLLEREEVSLGHRGRVAEGEAHHLRVRRVKDGEVVAIRDGAGLVGIGRLVRVGKEWEVEVESLERRLAPPELILAVGAGDRERFNLVVEKAVELGVTTLVPLETERTAGVATTGSPGPSGQAAAAGTGGGETVGQSLDLHARRAGRRSRGFSSGSRPASAGWRTPPALLHLRRWAGGPAR